MGILWNFSNLLWTSQGLSSLAQVFRIGRFFLPRFSCCCMDQKGSSKAIVSLTYLTTLCYMLLLLRVSIRFWLGTEAHVSILCQKTRTDQSLSITKQRNTFSPYGPRLKALLMLAIWKSLLLTVEVQFGAPRRRTTAS